MLDANGNDKPSRNEEPASSAAEFLRCAAQAARQGNQMLALHLYLAAFERDQAGADDVPSEDAIDGIKRAWRLACDMKERSIAEYVFERMEPYLSADEVAVCADQLQELAISKLEEFGLTRDELENMTGMLSSDLAGQGGPRVVHVEHLTAPGAAGTPDATGGKAGSAPAQAGREPVAAGSAGPAAGKGPAKAGSQAVELGAQPGKQVLAATEPLSYKELVGYDEAIKAVAAFGIGMAKDAGFQKLVDQLNIRHGLDRMPACDALLVRSPAREDANEFAMATVGELGLPVLRMRMEENLQGMPVLCVMSQADRQPKLNNARNAFEEPAVLVIEDIDLWAAPAFDAPEDLGGLIMSSLSRGAREAVSLIRNSADDPDVFVLCTAAFGNDVDPYFFDLLGPTSAVDIDYPTAEERADIWMDIAREHPSIRGVDRDALVRFSQGMPRYDMHMAAREAIEEAYKDSLMQRRYIPVTTDNLFDKLAAYQPLDSPEYKALEQAVVDDFREELDHLEDLLKGDGK